MNYLKTFDPEVFSIIRKEEDRQDNSVELIASENFVSPCVLEAVGSVLTNKYTEGYPDNRYYGGCENYDALEILCQERWKQVFKTDYHVNVQPHSGSNANLSAYKASGIKPITGKLLTLDLNHGGHLTHGSSANFSGQLYKTYFYSTDSRGFIDMSAVEEMAKKIKPDVIMCGASAYPRKIDFAEFSRIAKEVGAVLIADISHIAGLVATGFHPTPFGYADIITTTTHKTLRGTRGALIFCKPKFAKKVDSAVFPYSQGGSLQHIIAGKAVSALECLQPEYKQYIMQVCLNAHDMSNEFRKLGYQVVTGGTDNHLFLLDFSLTHPNITGKQVQDVLDKHGITLNKNCVPNETRSPKETSGVRIGTPAMTTKGWRGTDFIECARNIDQIIKTELAN